MEKKGEIGYSADDVLFVKEAIKVGLELDPKTGGVEILELITRSPDLEELGFMTMGGRYPKASILGVKNFAGGLLSNIKND